MVTQSPVVLGSHQYCTMPLVSLNSKPVYIKACKSFTSLVLNMKKSLDSDKSHNLLFYYY